MPGESSLIAAFDWRQLNGGGGGSRVKPFFGLFSAFATILAVVAGLTLAGASAYGDLYANVFRKKTNVKDFQRRKSLRPAGRDAYPEACFEKSVRTSPLWCGPGYLPSPRAAPLIILHVISL
ncbi:hypothetical protein KCP69_00755 [Salmonella enterica subsp. enterica]|nr:hypothetical protein KCP69_00755 [Salmonella enterica subsp. enterica]